AGAAARAVHRRDLPARDRAGEPLFRGFAAAAIRRLCLVRGEQRRNTLADQSPGGNARDLSVRSLAAGKGAMLQDIDYVVNKLDWMRHRRIWRTACVTCGPMHSAWCCWSRFTESLEICDTSVAE